MIKVTFQRLGEDKQMLKSESKDNTFFRTYNASAAFLGIFKHSLKCQIILFRSGGTQHAPRKSIGICTKFLISNWVISSEHLEKEDALAHGLIGNMHELKFIGCIYMFQHVLPILNQLCKIFQTGHVSFSHIEPAVEHAKRKLQSMSSGATPIKQLQEDFKPGGSLSGIDPTPTVHWYASHNRKDRGQFSVRD